MKILTKVKDFLIGSFRKKEKLEKTRIHSVPGADTGEDGKLLYDHRILTIEEDMINRMLRARFREHWFFHSITFEFEPNNSVYMGIITRFGNVMSANFTIEDLWFDDYSSTFELKVDIPTLDTGYFIFNSIIHFMGKWIMSFLGTFFNPFSIGNSGSTMRFEKNGVLRFDMVPESDIHHFIPLPPRDSNSKGPIMLYNARTGQSVLHLDYYAFHQEVETFILNDLPGKTNWLHSIDIIAILLLPVGVWISFIILHHYLPVQRVEFSFSTYFLISIGILLFSFFVMNIPRYIYMYFDNRKAWKSVFIHSNIKIQMRKLHRRIFNQQSKLREGGIRLDADYQEKIKELLLQIRDKRFLAQRLKIVDEDRNRKQKVKFVIAYVVCTFIEWVLLMG